MGGKAPAKRGPKSAEGRLAVRLNARKHGILSPRPVVAHFEREADWDRHRESITGSLSPEGGLEEALAERVALASWRLNRVAVYETEAIAQRQESVVEDLRRRRGWDPDVSLADAHPANPFDELECVSDVLRAVERFATTPDKRPPEDASLSGYEGALLLESAVGAVADLEVARGEEDEGGERRDELLENLPGLPAGGFLDVHDYTAGQLMELIEWLALQEKTRACEPLDDDELTPGEWLLEKMHTAARRAFVEARRKVEKVQAQLLEERRERILPAPQDLEKIGRYEAHLSRQMYQALHELEALQARKRLGEGAAPLARLDVQT